MATSPENDYWFAEPDEPHYEEFTSKAKAICATCKVRPQCSEYALAFKEEFGIWGGMTFEERKVYARRKRREEKRAALLAKEREGERLAGLDAFAFPPGWTSL